MIVVVGSRHDRVATDLAGLWPRAALCSAEDFVSPGWIWHQGQSPAKTWIVGAAPVRDEEVSGVFIRRSTVHAEELANTHPTDRAFLASEIHAFLTFVLATTSARVINPVCDGAYGEEALRPERWSPVAGELGISVRPLKITSEPRRQNRYRTHEVDVVGTEVFGDAPTRVLENARRLVRGLELEWARLLFDARQRLITMTGASRPGAEAAAALGRLLAQRRS